MNKPQYSPVLRRTRQQILTALSSQDAEQIRDALISASYWEDDWKWAQEQLLRFADFDSDLVKWAVATGISFLVAFNGQVDEGLVAPVLSRLKASQDKFVAGAAEEAEADVAHFVKARKQGKDVHLATRLPEDWRPPRGHFPE